MSLRSRAVAVPESRRTWLARFIVALTMGDSGRNGAEVAGCWHLHQTADAEREVYGRIMSESIRDHVEGTPEQQARHEAQGGATTLSPGCRRHWTVVTYV